MSELPIYYTAATIYFATHINHPKINQDIVSFSRNNCLIEAKMFPYNIPHTLSGNNTVQKHIIKPIIKKVTKDIETIDKYMKPLDKLAIKGKTIRYFYYERDIPGKEFKVYDLSYSARGRGSEKIIKLINFPQKLLKKEYQEFYEFSEILNQEKDQVPYVTGKTLKEATENILLLYSKLDKIKELGI
jgi:hypothetical protein